VNDRPIDKPADWRAARLSPLHSLRFGTHLAALRARRERSGSTDRGHEPPVWPDNASQHKSAVFDFDRQTARSLPHLDPEGRSSSRNHRYPFRDSGTDSTSRRHTDDDTRRHRSCGHRSGRCPANPSLQVTLVKSSTATSPSKASPTGRPPGRSRYKSGADKTNHNNTAVLYVNAYEVTKFAVRLDYEHAVAAHQRPPAI
jgi:hypothetical protein